MNIDILAEKIEIETGNNLTSIIELIIDAVRDYPLFGLSDTEKYFDEVKRITNQDIITLDVLKNYIVLNSDSGDEESVWINTSLTSLLEAFELMSLYKIPFDDVLNEINL